MGIKILQGAIVLVVSLISGALALGCLKKALQDSAASRNVDVEKVKIGRFVWLVAQVILAALSIGLTMAGNLALAIALVVMLIAGLAVSENGGVRPLVGTCRFIATPFAIGMISNIIVSFCRSNWDWKQLFWLIVPLVVFIWFNTVESRGSDTNRSGWKTIIGLAVIAGLVVASVIGLKALTKHLKQNDLDRAAAAATVNAEVKAEAKTEAKAESQTEDTVDEDAVEAINLIFANHELSEEDKALDSGMVLPQLDPEDSESKLSEFALGPMSEEMLAPVREELGWQVDWSSYPNNPVTGEPMTIARTHSAKELGYTNYAVSYASAPGFPKDWRDYVKSRDMDPETTEEEAIYKWIGELTGNYPAFLGMVHLFGNAETLGTKNRDIPGNEFFNEIEALAKEAEEEGKGITKFLDANADPKYSRYNFDWQTYRAKFMIWLSLSDFVGRKEWKTVEKSYLGPADGKSSDKFEYKFDYTNAAYVAPNFTTDNLRQTDLPSYVLCFRDKNGYRVSDWFGVNCATADAEIYSEQPAAKKATIKTGAYNPQQPSGSNKATTASTKNETKKDEPKKDEPKKDEPKKKTTSKGKSNSSVNKKENIIDGKNPIGQGTDEFQPIGSVPTNWGTTVTDAQYQPKADAQTSGLSNQIAQTPGTTQTTVTNGTNGTTTTTTTTATQNPVTGVVTTDVTEITTGSDGSQTVSHTENAEASTPVIPVKEENYSGGGSAGTEKTGNTEQSSKPLEESFGF